MDRLPTMSDTPANAAAASQPVRQYRFSAPPGACDMLLIRHGESAPVADGQDIPMLNGQADPPLDPQGLDEARRVGERLAREEITAIYASPLTRTQQTATPLAERLGLDIRIEPDLREVHLGEWEGVYRIRARENHPLAKRVFDEQDWGVIPGAEPAEEFGARVRAGIQRIADAHPDERVAVFVHGGVVGAVMHLAVGGGRRLAFVGAENGSLNHLVVMQDRWIIRRFNDTGHLATDLDKPVQPIT